MQKLLSDAEVAEVTGLTRGALRQMRYLGTGPVFVKVSARVIRYREADIEAFIDARLRAQTGNTSA